MSDTIISQHRKRLIGLWTLTVISLGIAALAYLQGAVASLVAALLSAAAIMIMIAVFGHRHRDWLRRTPSWPQQEYGAICETYVADNPFWRVGDGDSGVRSITLRPRTAYEVIRGGQRPAWRRLSPPWWVWPIILFTVLAAVSLAPVVLR